MNARQLYDNIGYTRCKSILRNMPMGMTLYHSKTGRYYNEEDFITQCDDDLALLTGLDASQLDLVSIIDIKEYLEQVDKCKQEVNQ